MSASPARDFWNYLTRWNSEDWILLGWIPLSWFLKRYLFLPIAVGLSVSLAMMAKYIFKSVNGSNATQWWGLRIMVYGISTMILAYALMIILRVG
jgi:hypothetical protein